MQANCLSGDCAHSGRTLSRGTCVTVVAYCYCSSGETRMVKFLDVLRAIALESNSKHLVEIAVVKPAVPAHTYEVPAHQTMNGCRIKGRDELLHVVIEAITSEQKV